jgi:hypothetical protein
MKKPSHCLLLLPALTVVSVASVSTARAAGPTTAPVAIEQKNADLQRRLDDMQRQMDELKQAVHGQASAAAAPTTPAAGGATFQSLMLDNKPVELPGDVTAGYNNGFYIKQGDQFSITANGVFDVRYDYSDVRNETSLKTTPLGTKRQGSLSGFSLYNGNVSLAGELFKQDQQEAFFKVTGNFGTLQTPVNTTGGVFFLNEMYGGYALSDALKFRAGAMITPLTPFLGLTVNGGLTFPTVASELSTFLPGFGLGADVGGGLFNNRVTYDLMINNGSVSQGLTNATSVLAGRDNRVGAYTREQFVGAGKLSDFTDESDTRDHQDLVWIAGFGFGYESQNDSSTAFPGPQSTLRILGLSSATGEGFLAPQTVNGDIYRYTADVRAKYHGFSFVGSGQYQHIADETGKPIIPGYAGHSIGQTGFFAQAAYMIPNTHLELAGRFGQLYTNGLHHEMDEWKFGVNYYIRGENLKIQAAETYVPRQAALTTNTGLLLNTQDWLTQVQLQMKF